ncbi:hypothetical protein [Streptomyces bluensis]|uniref:hypothetical protein n=1 Tax=Streptomyces bluensis TaxID=33897 RepID=UPI003318038B
MTNASPQLVSEASAPPQRNFATGLVDRLNDGILVINGPVAVDVAASEVTRHVGSHRFDGHGAQQSICARSSLGVERQGHHRPLRQTWSLG